MTKTITKEKKPTKRMPEGKTQFGIIVKNEIHRTAKKLAADMDCRYSDVYSAGVLRLADDQRSGKENSEKAILGREITEDIPEQDWSYFRALAEFMRSSPDPYQVQMLKALLSKYLPQSASNLHYGLKQKTA
jgi:hypothetical protein